MMNLTTDTQRLAARPIAAYLAEQTAISLCAGQQDQADVWRFLLESLYREMGAGSVQVAPKAEPQSFTSEQPATEAKPKAPELPKEVVAQAQPKQPQALLKKAAPKAEPATTTEAPYYEQPHWQAKNTSAVLLRRRRGKEWSDKTGGLVAVFPEATGTDPSVDTMLVVEPGGKESELTQKGVQTRTVPIDVYKDGTTGAIKGTDATKEVVEFLKELHKLGYSTRTLQAMSYAHHDKRHAVQYQVDKARNGKAKK